MTKQALRKIYLQKRALLTAHEYTEYNHKIYENFFLSIDLQSVKMLHIFLPIENKKEPDTWLIIDKIKKDYSRIKIILPRVNNETGALDNVLFEGTHQLKKNAWGIYEPNEGQLIAANEIDMVIVPMLAFDMQGNRVGYGKGFYDRLLSLCKSDCEKVGISLFDPIEEISDINEYDQPISSAVTPHQILKFT